MRRGLSHHLDVSNCKIARCIERSLVPAWIDTGPGQTAAAGDPVLTGVGHMFSVACMRFPSGLTEDARDKFKRQEGRHH
jgi:hypothetical protein